MTKTLRKAMMKRTELANKYNKSKNMQDYNNFRKHKNYVNRLYKKERKKYFNSLDINDVHNVKKFWKIWNPLISDKCRTNNTITLVKGNNILSNQAEVAEEFKGEFSNAVNNLNIDFEWKPTSDISNITDLTDKVIEKYKDHPSKLKINEHFGATDSIGFTMVSEQHILDLIADFDTKKATTFNNIPGKCLKDHAKTYSTTITELVNKTSTTSIYSDKLKIADLYPIHKKGSRNAAGNYRPVSVFPYMSKLFERNLKEQIGSGMEQFLSNKLCGYRKGFSAQHALIAMTEKWRKSLDKGGYAGAILMDLSKAFDCLNHDLLIAKLNAYGFSKRALKTIQSYLSSRWQKVKIENNFSEWFELETGVPQGSVLGPLLFNIYLNDLLLFIKDGEVCNFADDTTIFVCDKDLNVVKDKLEKSADSAIEWFRLNYLKLNTDKCKLIVVGRKSHPITVRVGNSIVEEEKFVKLLG